MKKKPAIKLTERKERDKKKLTEAARQASIDAKAARSVEARKAILYCFEIGITKITDACAYAGVSQDWYSDHVKAEPEFVELIEKAKAKRKALALRRILEAGETSWQAQAWYLERVHSTEYALKQRIQHEGVDQSPIVINVTPAAAPAPTQGSETHADDQHKSD